MTSDTTSEVSTGRSVTAQVEDARRAAEPRLDYDARKRVVGQLADRLLQRPAELTALVTTPGFAFLAAFLRPEHLEQIVAAELPIQALRAFAPDRAHRELRLVPRGVVCHWIAGNVPLLGMFSWAISMLLGNVNVVRVSSRQEDLLSPLLDSMAALGPEGRQLARETVVLQFDRSDISTQREMSSLADVRIAWGGREAVESIVSLPCSWETDTIVLGPRVSMAVVDPEVLTAKSLSRLATDIAYFDQQACSSPQVVFVKGQRGEEAFDSAERALSDALAAQTRRFPRHALDFGETYRIATDRARVALGGGQVRHDAGTQWTVACVEDPMDEVRCANRFVQLVPFRTPADILRWIPKNVQSVVLALSDDDTATFTELAAHRGVCRFPRPGQGNFFETPWDGVPLAARLVRWVVRADTTSATPNT